MVNIAYSGVLQAFPWLRCYSQPFNHVVKGVGENTCAVICKLVDVPVSLGDQQSAGTCIRTTFYVLECQAYHFILGLTLLSVIDGGVFCGSRRLTYTLGKGGKHAQVTLPLQTRTTARNSPAYKQAMAVLATPTPLGPAPTP
jgi:hypothetical protein